MLLYGIYRPSEHNISDGNRPRVYAFASVERLVKAIREVPGCGTGQIELITKYEAEQRSYLATLYTDIDEDGIPLTDGKDILISWGSLLGIPLKEIGLAQTIANEQVQIAAYKA
jgi:hypothetical protein